MARSVVDWTIHDPGRACGLDVELIDPLGRVIRLTGGAWYGRILKGHPEMRSRRPDVESGDCDKG